jgi:hypothetical protein
MIEPSMPSGEQWDANTRIDLGRDVTASVRWSLQMVATLLRPRSFSAQEGVEGLPCGTE